MAVERPSEPVLGCGRQLDDIWDNLGRPPDEHEAGCPDCLAARASLGGLAALVEDVRSTEAEIPELQPTERVHRTVLAVARAEVRRGRTILMPHGEGSTEPEAEAESDELTVSEQAIAEIVRRAADPAPEFRIRRVRVTSAESAEAPPGIGLRITASVHHRHAIPEAAGRLRRAIATAVTEQTGLAVTAVDIVVEDVHGH